MRQILRQLLFLSITALLPAPLATLAAADAAGELVFSREFRLADATRLPVPSPAPGLRFTPRDYPKHNACEWQVRLQSPTVGASALHETVNSAHFVVRFPSAREVTLHWSKGSHADITDFQPQVETLNTEKSFTLESFGGRSSDGAMPYFNLASDGGGLIFAVGWAGDWKASFEALPEGRVRITAGLQRSRFRLRAGEQVRLPSVLVMAYRGDWLEGQNQFRRLMLQHFTPTNHPAMNLMPVAASVHGMIGFNDTTETNLIALAGDIAALKLPLDTYWLDAGWNDGGFPLGQGNPLPDPARFLHGLAPVGKAVRETGMRLLVWFEPERAMRGTWLERKHPEWLLQPSATPEALRYQEKDGFRLLDLGNAEARAWALDRVSKDIRNSGITIYRQDFNAFPAFFWHTGESSDETGLCEVRYITGLYEFLDELARRHPGLILDNCASGGRRLDFEMMRRCVALWRSDSCWGEKTFPRNVQAMTHGLSHWLPLHGLGAAAADDNALRSGMGACASFAINFRDPVAVDALRRHLERYLKMRPLFTKDYYPLTPWSDNPAHWLAFQFHDPESGGGIVQAFSDAKVGQSPHRLKLRGLDPGRRFRVSDWDAHGTDSVFAGAELMEPGLPLPTGRKSGALVFQYATVQVVEEKSAAGLDHPVRVLEGRTPALSYRTADLRSIPAELFSVKKKTTVIEAFRPTPQFDRHDPSNIIRHRDRYWVFYTRNIGDHKHVSVHVASSADGYQWTDLGESLGRGREGDWDESGAIAPYCVPYEGKFYLFYTGFRDGNLATRELGCAIADHPTGPWTRWRANPILRQDSDAAAWDSGMLGDANVIFREGKWWLYFKSRRDTDTNKETRIGVAMADQITGPYRKHPANPLFAGHAFSAWRHREGVAALCGEISPKIKWSPDGLHFLDAGEMPNQSTGLFSPDANADRQNLRGFDWGLEVYTEAGARGLRRFDGTPAATGRVPQLGTELNVADYHDAPTNPAMWPIQDVPGLPRVLLIGDSISIGYTLPVRERLAGKANVHRIPENGGPTTNGLARLDGWLGTQRWDVIHFNWGLHDLKLMENDHPQVSLPDYERNLDQLMQRLKQTGAQLVWATTTPVPEGKLKTPRRPEDVPQYNEASRKVMEQHGIRINDLYAFALPQLSRIQIPANVHFTKEGSAVLARPVAETLLASLKNAGATDPSRASLGGPWYGNTDLARANRGDHEIRSKDGSKERSLAREEPHDYKSRVPSHTFGEKRDAQEAQLRTNSLMLRFAESRKKLSADPYRPIYHYVNPEGGLNDPNGLCSWQGLWHLFYQAYPPEDPRQHWGHAVSSNLVHWRDLPYAIYPDPEECCFSGATLIEESRVIAMYHGTKAGNMVAVADDPLLLNWTKVTGQPVIPLLKPDGTAPPYKVFDPCIWKKDGWYYSLSGGTLPHVPSGRRTAAQFLFRSQDLKSWEYLHPFVEGDQFSLVGDDGACPYFWPIGDRHLLLYYSHMSGSKYLLGDYDTRRDKFVVTQGGRFTFGSSYPGGVHAPSAAPDGQGGVVAIFNLDSGKPTAGWNQIMSLPRRLSLLPGKDQLAMEPAGAIESLRLEHRSFSSRTLPANREIVLDGVQGNALEILAEIEPSSAPLIELNILRSPGKEEFTRIAFYKQRGYPDWDRFAGWGKRQEACSGLITVDSSHSSELPDVLSRAPETAPVYLEPDEPLRLRVFIDKSVVEVFVNGRQCVSLRVYPGRADSIGVSLRAQGQDAKLKSLDAWRMKSIYE